MIFTKNMGIWGRWEESDLHERENNSWMAEGDPIVDNPVEKNFEPLSFGILNL